jgi:hypothetical protein
MFFMLEATTISPAGIPRDEFPPLCASSLTYGNHLEEDRDHSRYRH